MALVEGSTSMKEKKISHSSSGKKVALYQLEVILPDLPIWRKLLVRGDINLGLLHAVIQVSMGWTNSHLHQFEIGDTMYSDPRMNEENIFDDPPCMDEGRTRLMNVVLQENEGFIYEYDFGDSWIHYIVVEKIHEPGTTHDCIAECLDGGGACPPEDCGGIDGYVELLEIIHDPTHKEYESMREWLGGDFDPDAFDTGKVNRYLRQLKWPRTTDNQLARVLMARDGYRG
jgi:hypothetical protein